MADKKENTANDKETISEEKEVHIEPSESRTNNTGDPGRTPGKAEGEDDESAAE